VWQRDARSADTVTAAASRKARRKKKASKKRGEMGALAGQPAAFGSKPQWQAGGLSLFLSLPSLSEKSPDLSRFPGRAAMTHHERTVSSVAESKTTS
jgi:hypothetical protein